MEERVSFVSDKLRLSGVLHLPDSHGAPLAAFLVLHGFGSNKDGSGSKAVAAMLAGLATGRCASIFAAAVRVREIAAASSARSRSGTRRTR